MGIFATASTFILNVSTFVLRVFHGVDCARSSPGAGVQVRATLSHVVADRVVAIPSHYRGTKQPARHTGTTCAAGVVRSPPGKFLKAEISEELAELGRK